MPYSLDKEVSQDKGIAVNRNAITGLDSRLTIAESTLSSLPDNYLTRRGGAAQMELKTNSYGLDCYVIPDATGGWARAHAFLGGESFTRRLTIGALGNIDSVAYGFITANTTDLTGYAEANSLRVYPTYPAWGTSKIWHSTADNTTTGTVTVGGTLSANGGLSQDGHNILNGSDTWLRTNGNQGWYSATYGGGIRCSDTTYVEIYNGKRLKITSTAADSLTTTGGLRSTKAQTSGVSWTNPSLSLEPVAGTTDTTGRTTLTMGASANTAGYGYSLNVHRTGTTAYDPAFHINYHNNSTGGTEKFRITPTDTYSYNNFRVYNTNPILTIQDSNSTGNAATAYMEFRDSADTRHGWIGFGSASTDDITINNDANSTSGVKINGNTAWHAGNTICYSGQMGTAMTSPSGPAVLKFNEIWVNKGGITYDGATGKFTVPETGTYRITMNPFKRTGAGSTRVMVGVNTLAPTANTHKGHCFTDTASYATMCINSVVALTAGNYIVFYLASGGLYNQSSDRFNQYSIERIG